MNSNGSFRIGKREIGRDASPYIIAEMSGNHNKSLQRAFEIVDAAADSGVHALKLQTYTPDTMTLDLDEREFHIGDPSSPWAGISLYKLYAQASTPWEWHKEIFDRARARGLEVFSTPFDDSAVDFLEELNVPCYKIASFENTDLPLIRRVAQTGKPLIISSGLADVGDLNEAVRTARENGCKNIALLKCTSSYPASPENSNIRTIPHLRDLFQCEVGLSDHTLGIGVAVASVALGATVIEKHFTLDRSEGGVDSAFSLEPVEMANLVAETHRAWQGLGNISYAPLEVEKKSMQFRRSLYVVQNLRAGDVLTTQNVRAIRPGYGLPSKFFPVLLGKKVKKDVARGTAVDWSMI